MRLMTNAHRGGIAAALIVVVLWLASLGSASTAQEPTPEGRLGGGAPLDATIPVATVPPTATPTRAPAASPTAGPSPAGPSPAASQVASPVAGAVLGPAACAVSPRSLDEVAALLMLTESPVAPPAPTAAEWTPDAQTAAKAVVAELVACGNAGEQLAAYALLTDVALVEYLVGTQPNLSDIRALFFDEQPSLIPALVTGLETRSGEPGVVYLWLDLGTGQAVAATLTLAHERDAWRITGLTIAEPFPSS